MTSGFAVARMHEAGRRMAERDGGMQHPDWKKFHGRVHKLGGKKGGVSEKDVDPDVGGGVDRDKLPDSAFAGKDRSFPIVTPEDVAHAAKSIGRAGPDNYSTDKLRANIVRIAKRKGAKFAAQLPDAWKDGDGKKAEREGRATEPFKGQPRGLSRKFDDIVKALKRTGATEAEVRAAEQSLDDCDDFDCEDPDNWFDPDFDFCCGDDGERASEAWAAEDGVQNPYAVAWATLKRMGWRKDPGTGKWSGPKRRQAEDAVTVVPATDAPSNVDRYLDSIAGKEAASASGLGQLLRPGPGMGRPKPVGEAAIPPEWAAWRVQRMQRAVNAANAYEAVPKMVATPSGPRDGYREAPPKPASEALPPHADRRARADPEVEIWSGHKLPMDDDPKTVPTSGPPPHDPQRPVGTLPWAMMSRAPSVARAMIAKPGRAA